MLEGVDRGVIIAFSKLQGNVSNKVAVLMGHSIGTYQSAALMQWLKIVSHSLSLSDFWTWNYCRWRKKRINFFCFNPILYLSALLPSCEEILNNRDIALHRLFESSQKGNLSFVQHEDAVGDIFYG
ncbi:MAG: hypothetical protein BWY12_01119 [candidate division BRC1 bacterium ADurb.Bin183]|nr:MAG: hypothetical protein BWY12_01119 [candidate division BRC1 bacterium ADurb.Bin183]